MSIIRAPRPTSNFYMLDKRISEDKRLGWAARGLLIYLLGKPDNWQVSIPALIKETAGAGFKTGRDGVYRILQELADVGYVRHERGVNGSAAICDWVVCESYVEHAAEPALPENPTAHQDVPRQDFPRQDNPDVLLSTERLPRIESNQETPSGFVELPFDANPPAAKKPIGADLDKCVEAWNAICGKKLPPIRGLGGERKKQLPARLAELTDDPTQQYAEWVKLCKRIARSPHMTGDNNHGWIGSFDFVMKPANLLKILEGNYDPKGHNSGNREARFEASPGTI